MAGRKPKLLSEVKGHITKAQRAARKRSEDDLMTGSALQEWPEVRANEIAHKRFQKIRNLYAALKKDDALLEPILNRYCLLLAEGRDLELIRERIGQDITDLQANKGEMEFLEYIDKKQAFTGLLLKCDDKIQTKRKMLLDIEKENLGTITAMLRAAQKKPAEEKDPEVDKMNELAARRAAKK